MAGWIWIVATGRLAVLISSIRRRSNCRCSHGRAVVCASMDSSVDARHAPRRQRPSYSGVRCVERNGQRLCRRQMGRVRNCCEQRGTKGDTKHCQLLHGILPSRFRPPYVVGVPRCLIHIKLCDQFCKRKWDFAAFRQTSRMPPGADIVIQQRSICCAACGSTSRGNIGRACLARPKA